MTRILLLAVSATALSGCSFLGMGEKQAPRGPVYGGSYQAPAAPCCDQRLSTYNIEAAIGPSFIVGGEAVTGDEARPQVDGFPFADIQNLDMKDLYDTGYRAELGLSKALTPNRKVTATGHFTEYDSAGAVDWGTVGGEALSGGLSDYRSYGGELGLRQYGGISPAPILGSVRPYIEGRVGASYVEGIDIVGANLGGAALDAVPFYEGSWVGTGAGLVGVETPFIGNSTIGLETGIRYAGGLKSDTTALNGTSPLAGTNNGGEKWSVPLTLRGRYRF